MSLEFLLEDTFARGCGVSRAHALRTPRFKELLATVPHLTFTQPHEVAEMIYLGEQLADRAFQNLPKRFRDQAHAWQGMDEVSQMDVLTALSKALSSTQWHASRRAGSAMGGRSALESLPAAYGSWSRGKARPNCLGVSQMLIGFARATGACHMMVDVLEASDTHTMQVSLIRMAQVERMIMPYARHKSIKRLLRLAQRYQKALLRDLVAGREAQAHHALAIEVGEKWIIVDPYLKSFYALDWPIKAIRRHYGRVQKHPRTRMVSLDRVLVSRMEAGIKGIKVLLDAIDSIERRPLVDVIYDAAALFSLRFYDDKEKFHKEAGDVAAMLFNAAIATPAKTKLLNSMVDRKERALFICTTVSRTNASPYLQKRALIRALAVLTRETMAYIGRCERVRDSPHPLIEIGHPSLHLGVMTLNHQAHLSGLPSRDLIRFSNGQFLLGDTVADIQQNGCPTQRRVVRSKLQKLRSGSPNTVLAELQRYLSSENGVEHDN